MDTNIASNAAVGRRTVLRPPRQRFIGAGEGGATGMERALWGGLLGLSVPGAALVDELQALVTARDLPAGSLLVSRQQPARELLVLAHGDAALGFVQEGTPFQPERSLQGPDWLDPASAWLGGTPAQDAIALSDVRVLALPVAEVQALLLRRPELATPLLHVLAQQVRQLTTVAHDLMHKDAEARFSDWLIQRCVAVPDAPEQAVVTLHERKRDIAAQLGITPETLSRLLRQLSRKGLIEVRGYTVSVQDLGALRAIASS